jgi:hypothetical protein
MKSKNQLPHYVCLSYIQKLSTAFNIKFFLSSVVAAVGQTETLGTVVSCRPPVPPTGNKKVQSIGHITNGMQKLKCLERNMHHIP